MAKRRKNKKLSGLHKFLIVGGVIIAFNVIFIFVMSSREAPRSIDEAIKRSIRDNKFVDPDKRDLVALQLAINDFMAQNEGKLPRSLEELVPKYFDRVPLDPESGEPYEYKVSGNTFSLGDAEQLAEKKKKDGKAKQDEKGGAGQELIGKDAEDALIASLADDAQRASFVYDPADKRDPFMPFDFAPRQIREGATPLERFEIGQLKLTAVLGSKEDKSAIVEVANGRGYTVRKGTKMGLNSGEVVEIQHDRLLILETFTDFTGKTSTKTVEMRLRTPDQELNREGVSYDSLPIPGR